MLRLRSLIVTCRFVGTEAGEKQIPESLGLAPGLVFLICLIVFQQLQYYDFGAISEWLFSSSKDEKLAWVSLSQLEDDSLEPNMGWAALFSWNTQEDSESFAFSHYICAELHLHKPIRHLSAWTCDRHSVQFSPSTTTAQM